MDEKTASAQTGASTSRRHTESTSSQGSSHQTEIFAVSLFDPQEGYINPAYDYDELHKLPPPPPFPSSRPVSSISRRVHLPGSVVDTEDTCVPPPPNYVDCSFPPPTYDDLHPSTEKNSPQTPEKKKRRIIFWLCLGCLSIALLTIGILGIFNCEMLFLVLWNIVTGAMLLLVVILGLVKSLRKIISRRRNLTQILIYLGAIITACWLIAGTVVSLQEDTAECSREVSDMAIAAAIILCAFSVITCLCGDSIFKSTRTHPDAG